MSPVDNDHLTTLLYFYSTLPQVLGAILALTGTYSIFRLNGLKDDIRSSSQQTIDELAQTGFKYRALKQYIDTGKGLTLNDIIERLKYSQMSGDFKALVMAADRMGGTVYFILKSIGEELRKLEIEKSTRNLSDVEEGKLLSLQREEDEFSMLLGINNGVIHNFSHIQEFLSKTRRTFVLNGIIVVTLLAGFFFLPLMSLSGRLYWGCLIIGISLSAFSLFHILRYIVSSMERGLKGDKINYYIPPMPPEDDSSSNENSADIKKPLIQRIIKRIKGFVKKTGPDRGLRGGINDETA